MGWENFPEDPTTSPGRRREERLPDWPTTGVKSGALALRLTGAVWILESVF